jgi:Zn-dependent protease with chaperone function
VNFFEQQHRTRRRTGRLVFYFAVAVALIVLAINAIAFITLSASADQPLTPEQWLASPYWIWVTAGTLAVIGIGTLKTILELRDGGRSVAQLVGARRIAAGSQDQRERQLINIVEEMSIASGTPRPELYVMDEEPAINAFVAGYRPTEAVLVVTRGALDTLDRDELQGVIGHEYSHVLNGDMRLNIRLMGVLAGILMISQIGRVLMRSSSGGRGKGGGHVVLLGLVLFIVGYIGLFCGALIKAAVSRQREFLADASAVQFTRNPGGILGALLKIGGHGAGTHLGSAHADDISHFCFGESVSAGFTSLLGTHPPLDARIAALDPGRRLTAEFRERQRRQAALAGAAPARAAPPGVAGFADHAAPIAMAAAAAVDSIGSVAPRHLDYARALHDQLRNALPAAVLAAVEEGDRARSLLCALLLSGMEPAQRAAARSLIVDAAGERLAAAADTLVSAVTDVGVRGRLPLLNLLIPALKEMSSAERSALLALAERLVQSDRRVTVFEFALLTILRRHLDENATRDLPVRFYKYQSLKQELRLLFSVVARAGSATEDAVSAGFRAVMTQFDRAVTEPIELSQCSFRALDAALLRINQLAPLLKKNVIQACADCIIHDGRVLPAEAELLQALAVSLDCPMPPLLNAAA